MNELESLNEIIVFEVKEQATTQEIISAKLNRHNGNLWEMVRKGSIKFNVLFKLLDLLGFEVILRHKTGKEYRIKKP